MGQKVNPISLRVGYIRGWESNWFSSKKDFADKLIEDHKIRKYLGVRMAKAGLSKIAIERTLKRVTINTHSSKPGIIIGRGGAEVERIKEELRKLTEKEVQVNIIEIKKPELDAKLVGDSIAQQIQARISYKRVVKQVLAATMRAGAQGVKIQVSGRLAGAEIARSEQFREGRVPLHTLRADIDFALAEAQTVYGKIGIKVWIFKNEVYQRPDLSPSSHGVAAKGGEASLANKGGQKNTARIKGKS
eukprot:gene3008-3756_t